MKTRFPLLLGGLLAAALPVLAQSDRLSIAPASGGAEPSATAHADGSPLTSAELLRQLEALGTGDPITKLPRGAQPAGPKGADDKSGNGNGTTEITSKEATFDQKAHVAVFLGDVFVENPEFTVNSDKLTAYMHHDDPKDEDAPAKAGGAPTGTPKPKPAAAKASPAPAGSKATAGSGPRVSTATSGNASIEDRAVVTAPAKAAQDPAQKGSGGLEKAIAEGNVLIQQDKIEIDGSITHNLGRGRKAVYEAATGNITLTGNPMVENGINSCSALRDDTIIILNRGGQMKAIGPTKSTIVDSSTTPGASTGGSSKGNSTPAPQANGH